MEMEPFERVKSFRRAHKLHGPRTFQVAVPQSNVLAYRVADGVVRAWNRLL